MPMPRLTDHPSGMSRATRDASALRSSGCQAWVAAMLKFLKRLLGRSTHAILCRVPAEAGTYVSTARAPEGWVPAFAGTPKINHLRPVPKLHIHCLDQRFERRVARRHVHDPVDINAGGGDLFRRQFPELGDMLGLHDGQLRRRGHHRVEVAPGIPVDEVAPAVGAPRLDQCNVAVDRLFEDVLAAVEDTDFLALGEL